MTIDGCVPKHLFLRDGRETANFIHSSFYLLKRIGHVKKDHFNHVLADRKIRIKAYKQSCNYPKKTFDI